MYAARLLLIAAMAASLATAAGSRPATQTAPRLAREAPPARVRAVTWDEARPIVTRLEDALPGTLRQTPPEGRPAKWSAWLSAQKRSLQSRIAQGNVDSLVNLLLFGTSYTRAPRMTSARIAALTRQWNAGDRSTQSTLARQYQRRAVDLLAAAAAPDAGARMLDVRMVLKQQGYDVRLAADRERAIPFLFANISRVREEASRLAAELEGLRRAPDAVTALARRSQVFHDRGLSADSSVLTQFAVDRAVCELRERGVLGAGTVQRAAIAGPGLDFADKQEGFDFYEPQSLQPFTFADSLLRCGLAKEDGLSLTTVDVSPRVNGHLRRAADGARLGRPYRLVLPWNEGAASLPAALEYWKRAGDQVGLPFPVQAPAELPDVRARGVAVKPEIVRRLRPLTASIVSDRIDVAAAQRFDLVVATNVLVYYDTFQQTLALASIAAMLRPGGVLLTNDAVLEIPEVPIRSGGTLAVPFSDRDGDGERMIWYVRMSR